MFSNANCGQISNILFIIKKLLEELSNKLIYQLSLQSFKDFYYVLIIRLTCQKISTSELLLSETTRLWFHVTSPKNADKILHHGIRLKFGKWNANYSDGNAFYLGDDLKKAVALVTKNKFSKNEKLAVLTFFYEEDGNEDPLKILGAEGIVLTRVEVNKWDL